MGPRGCFLPSELPSWETGAGCLEEGKVCLQQCVPLGLAVRFSVGLLCPSSLLLSSTEALCPLPQQMPPSCPSPFQQPVNVVGAGFPARAAVNGWGLGTETSPLPRPGSPLCCPLGCPAAQSLAWPTFLR